MARRSRLSPLGENAEAFGLMVNGPVRMGGGSMGHGFTDEVRHNGTNPVRSTRWQASSTGVQALSTAAYTGARALALRSDGLRPVACLRDRRGRRAHRRAWPTPAPSGSAAKLRGLPLGVRGSPGASSLAAGLPADPTVNITTSSCARSRRSEVPMSDDKPWQPKPRPKPGPPWPDPQPPTRSPPCPPEPGSGLG